MGMPGDVRAMSGHVMIHSVGPQRVIDESASFFDF